MLTRKGDTFTAYALLLATSAMILERFGMADSLWIFKDLVCLLVQAHDSLSMFGFLYTL